MSNKSRLEPPLMIPNVEAILLRTAICAENAAPGFSDRACAAVLHHLRRLGGEASGECLVDAAKLHHGCDPADSRAYGPVFQRLAREGWIVQAGWCMRKKGHLSGGGRVWRLCE